MKRWRVVLLALAVAALAVMVLARRGGDTNAVVVYTSVDQEYAEPIFRECERQTGLSIRPLYDVEATKTTGLVNRLIAEKENPQAEVWWSSEFVQTDRLVQAGVLAAGTVRKLHGRCRVLIVNTDLVTPDRYPRSVFDLLGDTWPAEQIGISSPLFGTVATHAAMLAAKLGPEPAREFFRKVKARGVRVVDGNSVIRDMVARGELLWGLTDNDDALGALKRGAPVAVVPPDIFEEGVGLPVIPMTAGLVAGSAHEVTARRVVEWLTGDAARELLANAGFLIDLKRPDPAFGWSEIPADRWLAPDAAAVCRQFELSQRDLRVIFSR